jgi:DNA primase
MGKAAMNQASYVIEAKLETSGMVEKSDVVGAIFGQTEGLLGDDLNLKELRKRGKVSRMEVEMDGKEGKIRIPTSMNATDTSLLAASLETIEKVGPSNADITVEQIQDQRSSKRDYIVKRAKQLLSDIEKDSPDKQALEEDLKKEIRQEQVTEYRGFPSGPDAEISDEIILVEGEADVKQLLKHGVKNAVALGGTSVPEGIKEISEGKDVTVFVDGDRGGELILKELKEENIPRYFTEAPENKEVEELSSKEIHEALRDREPVKYAEIEEDEAEMPNFEEEFEELVGTRAAMLIDEERNEVKRLPVSNFDSLDEEGWALVIDGEIDSEKVEKAEDLGLEYLAGKSRSDNANSSEVGILTRERKVEA